MSTREIGRLGEDRAARFLQSKGYDILENNFYSRSGEIDIIARKGNTLVCVEVKTRTSESFGLGEESIGKKKILRMKKTIDTYFQSKPRSHGEIRFDAVIVKLSPSGKTEHIEHLEDILS